MPKQASIMKLSRDQHLQYLGNQSVHHQAIDLLVCIVGSAPLAVIMATTHRAPHSVTEVIRLKIARGHCMVNRRLKLIVKMLSHHVQLHHPLLALVPQMLFGPSPLRIQPLAPCNLLIPKPTERRQLKNSAEILKGLLEGAVLPKVLLQDIAQDLHRCPF